MKLQKPAWIGAATLALIAIFAFQTAAHAQATFASFRRTARSAIILMESDRLL
jgi:hypothetical protein